MSESKMAEDAKLLGVELEVGGETYYIPDIIYVNCPATATNSLTDVDMACYDKGLMCKTKEQAVKTAEAMTKVAREMQGIDENE